DRQPTACWVAGLRLTPRRVSRVSVILGHARRKILHLNVTQHPTAGWLSRQITEAFPWDTAPPYLLRDRDASYGSDFRWRVEAMDISEVVTAPRSPWQNPYVERVIGSIRRECLDHVIVTTTTLSFESLRRWPTWSRRCGVLPVDSCRAGHAGLHPLRCRRRPQNKEHLLFLCAFEIW